MKPDDPMKH